MKRLNLIAIGLLMLSPVMFSLGASAGFTYVMSEESSKDQSYTTMGFPAVDYSDTYAKDTYLLAIGVGGFL